MKVTSPTFLFFIMLILIYPVSAETVTIDLTDLDLTKNFKILVYNATGEKVGELESGGNITINSSSDYVFIVKPTEQSWFTDPLLAIEYLRLTIPIYLNYILFLVTFLAGLYLISRIGR